MGLVRLEGTLAKSGLRDVRLPRTVKAFSVRVGVSEVVTTTGWGAWSQGKPGGEEGGLEGTG